MSTIKTALVSVSDKTNLEVLATFFKINNVKVISTGGTFKALESLGVDVKKVSEQTDFPEVMGGRVKTLHPLIHMGLLARAGVQDDQDLLNKYGIAPFDMLVVNLYPFSQKQEEGFDGDELTEFIDVGGPSMIRAGAKNFNRITVLTSPNDYSLLDTEIDLEKRKWLAGKAFRHLSEYDEQIHKWLLEGDESQSLRYGENPHQKASWSYDSDKEGLHQATILQGKELSFNNLIDLTAAVESLSVIGNKDEICVVSVKHNNPCGVAVGKENLNKVLQMSLGADPKSVFGGIVSLNREVDEDAAKTLTQLFLECVVAPSYTERAKEVFKSKKNLRILEWPKLKSGFQPETDFKRVSGGKVYQNFDVVDFDVKNWELVSGESPNESIIRAAKLAWKSVARVKSNAIAISSDAMTLGLGMGQVNRVDAVKSAISRWKEFHKDQKSPLVLASDAFFPFSDSIELIHEYGIKWVVQPGGSIRDKEVIEKANSLGVGMFFTGKRHFLH